MSEQGQPEEYIKSGKYEYSFDLSGSPEKVLQVFSLVTMNSTYHNAQETLDLLLLLEKRRSELEAAVEQQAAQAQQPKPKKSLDKRLDDLFH